MSREMVHKVMGERADIGQSEHRLTGRAGEYRERRASNHTRAVGYPSTRKKFKFEDKCDQEFHVLTKADNNGRSIRLKRLQSVRGMAVRT